MLTSEQENCAIFKLPVGKFPESFRQFVTFQVVQIEVAAFKVVEKDIILINEVESVLFLMLVAFLYRDSWNFNLGLGRSFDLSD